jgi:tripartite-type tricarboxylate transporter receptor subunit TctC
MRMAIVSLLLLCTAAAAQTFPSKPIRVIVPSPPGDGSDVVARLIGEKLSAAWGQQIVVDNRTGAGGVIGASIVAGAEPDGYTLLCAATPSQVIGPQLYKSATKYDPLKAFTPVGMFAITQNVLIANQKAPFNNVKELIGYAKANPGKLNWGNAGIGFQSHLAGVLFTHMAKINVLHVAYKGAGPMVTGVISGESQLTLGPAPAWMTHVQAGRVRALAMGGEKRSILWPDLPTIGESGLPGYVSDGWAGVMAPRGLPKSMVDKLHGALVKAVNDPTTNEALKKVGAEPSLTPPAQFGALIEKDWKTYGEAIRIANVKVE